MDFTQLGTPSEIMVFIILSLLGIIGKRISEDLRKMTQSVERLNANMEMIVSRIELHEKRLDKLEGVK